MATSDVKVNPNQVLVLNLSDVFVDPSWNTRSAVGEAEGSGGEEGENDFVSLRESIEMRGQDIPVDVRPNPNKTKHHYALVAGFRRFKAIQDIAEKAGNKTPTVRALVHTFATEADAIEFNMRENTARADLSAPDTVYGISRLLKANPSVTDSNMAKSLGFSQPYVSKVHRVIDKVSPKLLTLWRDSIGVKLTLEQMHALTKIEDKAEQTKAYEEMVRGKAEKTTSDKRKTWIESTMSKAHSVGMFLGKLAMAGHIEVYNPGESFVDGLDAFVKVKSEADDKLRLKFSDALAKGYEEGLTVTEEEPEKEKEPKKAKKAKNGASTSAN